MTNKFEGYLKILVNKAIRGTAEDIDFLMKNLTLKSTLAMTRYVDFALSLVENEEGIDRIHIYLLEGTLIQRNYASLYFNRIGEWEIVKEAFDKGLIDEVQAFAR